ncbi:amino acid adenylation domain-containing protein [Agrobacterium tumefaciens]|uniref:non-ribosomal peptide synthetase n=1 Tax=Agrobacterium tumefaciens TaxID=358 RepID=UPI001573562D|nr:non-ribosomal peptide synthetase [Agrobacterium tumefaciens]NSZ03824.1 amino acid adenylation domain-containing protein [Agrobacterium tumefaciens]NSZ39352.1 amino acid adenylation domain-containing protein [Agrobacterium tumefaciens]NTB23495.1 amino acid adenylation domain-containing protein [Agrobacterium tumefaciens]NTB29974.1 amino acid adenylation domain-containing protein [Agrobacterium tumefaciens]NTB33783.1 amino acid adenylation domain-containing protein [Agrobacterium tumefaciens]
MNELFTKIAALSPERRQLLEKKLKAQGIAVPAPSGIPRRADQDAAVPLSSAQQRLWFMQQLEPETVAYNMNLALRLKGPLDRAALSRAYAALVARHEPLRTRFPIGADGQPRQFVEPQGATEMGYNDCRQQPAPEEAARRHVEAMVETPYDLSRPPIRATLTRVYDSEHVLALGMHHIISDRWSMGVFTRDLSALYHAEVTGKNAGLAALPVQFADWTLWQRGLLEGPALAEQLSYWTGNLAGDLPVLELPLDRPHSLTASFSGAHFPVRIDRELSLKLRALAVEQNISLFTLLLAAFNVLLHLYTDSDDIVVGSEIANRDRPETQNMMGPLVNTLVFRNDLSGDPTFMGLLRAVATTVRQGFAHQEIPFERLVEAINPERSLSDLNPLFNVKFDIQHSIAPPPGLHGLSIEVYPLREVATKYDLRFNLEDDHPDIKGKIEYSSQIFDESSIATMLTRFERLLDLIVRDPSRRLSSLSLLTPQEETAIISAGAGPVRNYPTQECLHDLFLKQAAETPDTDAVTDGDLTWSYRELEAQSSRVAASLIAAGVKTGDRVGICMRRSSRMIAGILGIMRAGAAYVPLDADYPANRLAFIAEDSAITTLLVDHQPVFASEAQTLVDIKTLPEIRLKARPTASPSDLAYIIYTSGSTGRPKGVAIEHRSVVAFMYWARERFTREEVARMFVPTSISFDLSIFELYAPLILGGTLVVADHFLALPQIARTVDVTFINTVPSLLQEMLQEHRLPASVRTATFCGEPLPAALVAILKRDYPELRILNLYGPSEDTCFSTEVPLHGDHYEGGVVPIGKPLPNTQGYILDRVGRLRPPSLSGELYLAGTGLARGYFGRPEQTAERFIADPFSAVPGSRLYRTGDRIRRRADGNLEFCGRLDHQVKVRGLRIETGEIEYNIERLEGVEKAVIAVTDGVDRQLAAFIEPKEGMRLDETQLRRTLSDTLPVHMIPTLWYFLPRLPQQPNGKVDRAALPALAATATISSGPPQTATERRVADAWADVLAVETIGRDDNFFRLGGHSLLAMRMIARLSSAAPTKAVLRKLFEFPRLKDFAAALELDETPSATPAAGIAPLPDGAPVPLSFAQQRLWTLAELEPESAAYNVPAAVRFHGPLDIDTLEKGFAALTERHAALRTRIVTRAGQPVVEIDATGVLDIDIVDLDEVAVTQALVAASAQPFDLATGPLFRVRIFRLSPEEHVVLVVIHHIVSDAQSVQLILRDLTRLYNAVRQERKADIPPLALTYGDFAAWQREQPLVEQIDYWRRLLENAPPLLELPTDFPRGARQSFKGGSVRFNLDAKLSADIVSFAHERDATPFMVVLSAFSTLLARYSGASEVVVGTPVSERPNRALEDVIGLFVNTLALKMTHDASTSFAQQVDATRTLVLEAFRHQDAPFECVVDALSVERNWSHNPVFQTMFTWQADDARSARPDGLTSSSITIAQETSKVDLTLDIRHRGDRLACTFIYRSDLFRGQTIAHMADAFATLIEGLISTPERPQREIAFLPQPQRQQIALWNATAKTYDATPKSLHGFFTHSASRTPDAIAVTDRDSNITYAELDRRSDTLARHLACLGIGRGSAVGICLERNVDLIAAMLAVLKTGAMYVPLDPKYPEERIAFVARDAGLSLLLTCEKRDDFANINTFDPAAIWNGKTDIPDAAFPHVTEGSDLAYLIYTSGSTGLPKGVAIEHRNAVAFTHWALEQFPASSFAGMLASTSVCFDLSIFEIFVTLAAGGRIFVVDDLFELPDVSFSDEITFINTVPTPMTELLRFGPLPVKVKTVCLAGEPLPPSLARMVLESGSVEALHNLYGPSEDTTYSTGCRIENPDLPIHIGKPIANTTAHVLDAALNEVPIGMPGELYLAGEGIARGYHNRPDLTAERFLPNPFDATGNAPVLYKTGDRVRRSADGNIDYLGRADRQMKISGFRIEPGEIEAVLMRYPGVTGSAVDAWRDETGYARLAAWVETAEPIGKAELSAHLARELPRHFVPTLFAMLDKLPRLPNGKLDRKALPDPSGEAAVAAQDETPHDGFETTIAAIWSKQLDRQTIGRNDNFFALGGDSILAIQVVAAVRRVGIAITPRDLFQYSTLAALAASLSAPATEAPAAGPVTGEIPLGPAQHWFFEQDYPQPDHWNQAVLLKPARPVDREALQHAMDLLHEAHDVLRSRFQKHDGRWSQAVTEVEAAPPLRIVSCAAIDAEAVLAAETNALQRSFDLTAGPVWGATLVTIDGREQRLAIAAHHLVIDGVSWRILLDDLQVCLTAAEAGVKMILPARTTGIDTWVRMLESSDIFDGEKDGWLTIAEAATAPIPTDRRGSNLVSDTAIVDIAINPNLTARLIRDVPSAYPINVEEVMLAALYSAVRDWTGRDRLRLILESHGRPDLFDGFDLTRTVGWFTGLYPVLFDAAGGDTRTMLLAVKESLRRIANDGIGYGVLKYLKGAALPELEDIADIRFNYLGQTDMLFSGDALLSRAAEPAGDPRGARNSRGVLLDINAIVIGGQMRIRLAYSDEIHDRATIESLAAGFRNHLENLVDFCLTSTEAGYTPADFKHMTLDQDDLEAILRNL